MLLSCSAVCTSVIICWPPAGAEGTIASTATFFDANRDGKLAFRLNAVGQGTDGYRDGRDGTIAGVNPSFVWRPDQGTRVALAL